MSAPLPAVVSGRKTRSSPEAGTQKRHFRTLPKEFRRHGFDFRQIAREDNAAIYEQRSADSAESSVAYEVVVIKRRKGFQIKGRLVPAAEVYPRSEQWGELGWTVCNRDDAFGKLRELQRSSSNSPQKEPS